MGSQVPLSGFVLIASLLGLSSMLLISIREREPEIKLLRMIGAPAWYLFMLIQLEALIITLLSIGLGVISLWLSISVANDFLAREFGLFVGANLLGQNTLIYLIVMVLMSWICALLPAAAIYVKAR